MYGRRQKIGVFGGSFNPIHNGHMMIAAAAAAAFDLDFLFFVPNPNPPHKAGQEMPPGYIRAEMTARAIGNHPVYALSSYELHRQHDCYTCNTLSHFREKYPEDELYFIMGADSLRDFPTWRSPAIIASLAVLCVACRDELEAESLTALADEMALRYHADIRLIPCEGMDVSATGIREMAAAGKPFDHLVPPGVAEMIKEKGLYLPEED